MSVLPDPPLGSSQNDSSTGKTSQVWASWYTRLQAILNDLTGDFAPSTASYITKTASTELTNEQPLSTLSSGFVKVTTGTGELSSQTSITSSDLDTTAVTPGSYGSPTQSASFTVDSTGRITEAHNEDTGGNNTNITSMSGLTGYLKAPLGVKGSTDNIVVGFSDQNPTPNKYVVIRNDSTAPFIQTSSNGDFLNLSCGELVINNNSGLGIDPAILGISTGYGYYLKFTCSTSQAGNTTYTWPLDYASANSQMLLSATDGTLSWSTSSIPTSAGATANKVLLSDGTNYVLSTPTFPNASATAGKFIRSDGTNWIASTPTLPTSAGTSGKVLQSDGTNYVESTPTYPSTSGSARKILVSDGTNNVYSTETYAVPGTSGNVLTSDGTNWTSAAPAGGGSGSWARTFALMGG